MKLFFRYFSFLRDPISILLFGLFFLFLAFAFSYERVINYFNAPTQEEIAELDSLVIQARNKVYMKSLYNFHEIDLVSGTIRNPGFLNTRFASFSPSNGFQVGDKFYFFYSDRFWEFDPVYFY